MMISRREPMEKLLQMRKLSSISTWLEVVSALHNNSESASRLTGWASIQNTRELEEHKFAILQSFMEGTDQHSFFAGRS